MSRERPKKVKEGRKEAMWVSEGGHFRKRETGAPGGSII